MLRFRPTAVDRLLFGAAAAGFAFFALHLLYSAVCAFSWKNFLMMDYGAYTNFLYNLAHGDGFRFLYEHDYLKTHLSFSFVLLAPLVWLCASPLLLIVVQWAFLMGGAAILARFLRRAAVPRPLAAALLFAFAAGPLTQSVMLSEFHGVSAYFLLFPWLLYAAAYRKPWTILPLLAILGLREDAGLLVLPLILYFAVRDRWKTGYVLAAAALAYVLGAIFLLYPWLNGVSLFGVRADEASVASIAQSFSAPAWTARGQAAFWVALPAMVFCAFFRRAWIPALVFPSVALLQALGSGMERQYELGFHYPAASVAALACALAVAAARPEPRRRLSAAAARLAAAGLIGATLAAHVFNGYFLGGGASHRIYARFHPQFHSLHRLALRLPKDGLLLANQNLAPYFALRPDVMVLHYYDPARHVPDFIVTDLHEIQTPKFAPIRASVESGEFGLFDQEFPYLVLRRGHPADGNPALLEALRRHQMVPALMFSHGGDLAYDREFGLLKDWDGRAPEPLLLVFGRAVELPAGAHVADFELRVPPRNPPPAGGCGMLAVYFPGHPNPIAQVPIQPGSDDDVFAGQELPFVLAEPALVEPRIVSGGAPLQARGIRLRPAAAP